MDWQNLKVLVTGAGGFIGSHLAEILSHQGAHVRAFVHYNSRSDPGLLKQLPPQSLAKIEILAGDLRDPSFIHKSVEGCDIVFHLGALISIPYSYLHPYEVAETNFLGTLYILMACKDHNVRKLIHTSSSEVYGTAMTVPISEAHPLQGQSPYSASKIGADKLVESFFCTYNLPVVTIRPFNTYGPRQSARAVIPAIITQAITQKQIFIGNLDTSRDFTYVSDTVHGFIKAAETDGIEGRAINLGTGRDIKIGDLAQLIIRLINPSIKLVSDPNRLRPEKSEVYRLLSDYSLAREVLDWEPEVGLEMGLKNTILWIKEHLDLYRIGTYEF
jgi:NAD dependent epimerase/dehydratase